MSNRDLDLVKVSPEIEREALILLGKVNKLFAKRKVAVCALVISTLIAKYVKQTEPQYREAAMQTLIDNAFEVLKDIE